MKFLITLLTLFFLVCNSAYSADFETEYLAWWYKYNDENLIEYLTHACTHNQDLKIASIQVKQSEQILKQAFANQLPYLGFQGDISRTFTASDVRFGDILIPDHHQSRFLLPLSMNYEVDIWGENYLKTKSVKKQTDIARENERATYIALMSAVASDYFNLVKMDKIIENYEKILEIQTNIVEKVEIKYNNGLCPITELLNEKQILTYFQKTVNSLKNERKIISRELGVLTGEREKDDEFMRRGNCSDLAIISLPESLSAEVIQFRPDMLKAEIYVQKVGIDVKVARRDFLPKFLIYGNTGFNAYSLGNIFGNHTFLSNIGVMPSLDLFTGGFKLARLRYNKLELEKAQQIYEKTILTSVQEVNNSMSEANKNSLNYKESLKKYDIEKQKFALSNRKFEIGAKSKLDNMREQEALLLAEVEEASSKIDYLISTVGIYKAIGGKDFTTINDSL